METITAQAFDYLKTWDRARLYARLEEIRPSIDFLLNMHNAGIKVAGLELAYLEGDLKETPFFTAGDKLGRYSLHFDSRGDIYSSNGFPETLETFIHNFCTFLCAEKMMIEYLLES